jgi:hypothetical protein
MAGSKIIHRKLNRGSEMFVAIVGMFYMICHTYVVCRGSVDGNRHHNL